ncbi:MAG: hypothetical protein KJ864_02110 [Candidatus Omnitrophica bacterium]|nr:hypothetical protein [Candidatus Omnitrophota bacterium]
MVNLEKEDWEKERDRIKERRRDKLPKDTKEVYVEQEGKTIFYVFLREKISEGILGEIKKILEKEKLGEINVDKILRKNSSGEKIKVGFVDDLMSQVDSYLKKRHERGFFL